MRIVLSSDIYPPVVSGVSTVVDKQSRALAARGHEVVVIAPGYPPYSRIPITKNLSHYSIWAIPNILRDNSYTGFVPSSHIRTMFNEFHPDLVHFHSIGPIGYPTLKAAKHLRIPTIATLHGIPQFITAYTPWLTKTSKKNTHRALWLVLRNYYNQMQYITAPSQFASNQMREHGVTPPITVLPMWIDKPVLPINSQSVRKKFSLPKGHYIFLYIGRIDRDKNLLVALLAAEKLKHIASSFRIVFAGKGSYLPALKNLTNKRSLSDVISWIGYIEESDKFNFYRQADSFIMPSSVETQSLTTLEAIQSGLPVIIANAGALPEIEHQFGEQCTLFQYNDPNELARVMAHQLHVNSKIYSPHLFKSYYSKNYHIRSLEGLYKKLINVK